MQKIKKLNDRKAMPDILAKGWPWIVSIMNDGKEIMFSKHRTQQAAAGYAARNTGRVIDLDDHVKEQAVAPLVAAFVNGRNSTVEAERTDPHGFSKIRVMRDEAEKAFELACETALRQKESGAERDVALHDARVAYDETVGEIDHLEMAYAWCAAQPVFQNPDSTLDEARAAYDVVRDSAMNNPTGQDYVRETAEELEGTKWQLSENLEIEERSLIDRVDVYNLVVDVESYGETVRPSVSYSVIVDYRHVARALEWLDENGDIVDIVDRNNCAWAELFGQVADALGEDDQDAVHEAVIERLAEALEQLPTPPDEPQDGEDEEFDEGFLDEIFEYSESDQKPAGNSPLAASVVRPATLFLGVAKDNKNGLIGEPAVVAVVKEFTPEASAEFDEDDCPTGEWSTDVPDGVFLFGHQSEESALDAAFAYLVRRSWKASRAEAEADAVTRQRQRLLRKAPHNRVVGRSKAAAAALATFPPQVSKAEALPEVGDYDPAAVKPIPFDELPVELGTETEDSADGEFEAFEVPHFLFSVLGLDEPREGIAHILLCKNTGVAGVAVDFGSALWVDAYTVEEALHLFTEDNEAARAEFDEAA